MKLLRNFGLAVLAAAAVLAGCAGTKAAYQAAESLDDTAYVISEHYAAVVHEAADLREQGVLTGDRLARVQAADNAIAPVIASLKTAVDKWAAVKNAENELELQAAVDDAAVELAKLITALKGS